MYMKSESGFTYAKPLLQPLLKLKHWAWNTLFELYKLYSSNSSYGRFRLFLVCVMYTTMHAQMQHKVQQVNLKYICTYGWPQGYTIHSPIQMALNAEIGIFSDIPAWLASI